MPEILGGEFRDVYFEVTTDSDGCVLGATGGTGVTVGLDMTVEETILHWEIYADDDNADNVLYKKGAAAFVDEGAGVAANYLRLAPGVGDEDPDWQAGPLNQTMRIASDGGGDVVLTGRVKVRVEGR